MRIFPLGHAIEWVLKLRNGGPDDSPMLENILPLHLDIPVPAGSAVTFHRLHGGKGAPDYTPVDKILAQARPSG